MINYAKNKGIVTFKFTILIKKEFTLEKMLADKYHLKEVSVYDLDYSAEEDGQNRFGAYCAEQLEKYISDNMDIGIMSGKSSRPLPCILRNSQKKDCILYL